MNNFKQIFVMLTEKTKHFKCAIRSVFANTHDFHASMDTKQSMTFKS